MSARLPEKDIKTLALLVHKGRLAKEQAGAALEEAPRKGLSLETYLVRKGWLEPGEWEAWKRAGGEPPRLRGYEILARAGEGGSAVVYKARDLSSGKVVALKAAREEVLREEAARERFLREGRLLCELRHPGIVRAWKLARQGDVIYLVMEYIDGETAQDRILRGERFSEEEALEVVLRAARALEYLASRGIVHRDVKPGNLMLARDGSVKLLDLGLAAGGEAEVEGSRGEATSGTAYYMAPEQARGDAVDQRADIYSLGVSFFHMVTGELPFEGADRREVMRAHMERRLSSAAVKERSFSPLLAYFIQKMTAKDVDVRYQEPGELIRDLEEKLRGFKEIREQGRVSRKPAKGRKRRKRRFR